MSDTKWRRLFLALAVPDCDVRQGVFQFFRAPAERRMALPGEAMLAARWVLDSAEIGPYPYSSIVWLDLLPWALPPGRECVPAAWRRQNLGHARRLLETLGRLPIEESEGGLRIRAYAR